MSQMASGERSIAEIVVGARHRHDLGDVASLARSIESNGLLHPVVIHRDGRLIAGERRLEAFKLLGRTEIPVTEVKLEEIVRGELAENVDRKGFLPSEIEAIRRTLEPVAKAAAKARQAAGKEVPENCGKDRHELETSSRIGAFAGVSGCTVEKIAAVVAAAEAEPEKYRKLAADMDRSGRVDAPYRRLRNIKAAEAIRAAPPPLPGNGPYGAGFIDVPWAYELLGETALTRGVLPYPTMTLAEACAFPVRSLLQPDAAVGVWVTNFILLEGLHVPLLKAWGLEAAALVTWPKDQIRRGHYLRGQTEHFIIATRGQPTFTLGGHSTLLKGPFHLVRKGAHSAKPIEAYDWFESLVPAPRYFDLFSRHQHSERWDCHGFEAPTEGARREARIEVG
jgi:N6-adenosine-specific RNA methylase IME4/ParB-like chromosome segregation protein Spo0J